jgi:hypothetical protein
MAIRMSPAAVPRSFTAAFTLAQDAPQGRVVAGPERDQDRQVVQRRGADFDRLARRRDRKRHERIRAGVLGLAIAVAVGWLAVDAIRSLATISSTTMPRNTQGVPRVREPL